MLSIEFHRVSVCMGDDVWNGKYTIEMPDDATLGEQTPLKDLGIKWTFGSRDEKTKG